MRKRAVKREMLWMGFEPGLNGDVSSKTPSFSLRFKRKNLRNVSGLKLI